MYLTPELHSILLGCASIAGIGYSGLILARNPVSAPARMHAVYGATASWWFFCMAMVAGSEGTDQLMFWSRLAHLAIGMLPALIFHLNVLTAAVAHEHRTGIWLHYGIGIAVTTFCLTWPTLFSGTHLYSWGPYPAYTAWGLIPIGYLAVSFIEILLIYRKAIRRSEPETAYREKASAFYHGNIIAAVAMVDFFAVYGIGIYPFGFALITLLHVATLLGAVRYRLIEITPEFAAEKILNTLQESVLVADSIGIVRLANNSSAQLLQRDMDQLINQPITKVVSDAELLKVLSLPINEKQPAQELHFSNEDRKPNYVRITNALLHDQMGASVARIWVIHDLTDQKTAEAEKDRLEGWIQHNQKFETLGVMAGGIAHDFNNLLAAIVGSADIALDRMGSDSIIDEELQTIISASEKAADLTNQMLTYAGEMPLEKAPVDLNNLTRDIVGLMRSAISRKAHLNFELTEPLPRVLADKSQMDQVILNLITNASDALDDKPGDIKLRTGLLCDPIDLEHAVSGTSYVFVEVSDSGVGMDSNTKQHLFDPFYSTKFAGRGLGLATVAGIVKSHQGLIRVESELATGTRFTVAFPVVENNSATEALANDQTEDQSPSGVALVADDEPEVRNVAGRMLATAGYTVVGVNDGAEAVEVFESRQHEISLVLLDLTMPNMDGNEAYRRIRSRSSTVPIILMSGYKESGVTDIASGEHTAFLHKPFRSKALNKKLKVATAQSLH